MEDCVFCKELNEENSDIDIDSIFIRSAGHFNWYCPIRFCPACGTKLEKYSNNNREDRLSG